MLDIHFSSCIVGTNITLLYLKKSYVENSKYLKQLSIVVPEEIPIQYKGKLKGKATGKEEKEFVYQPYNFLLFMMMMMMYMWLCGFLQLQRHQCKYYLLVCPQGKQWYCCLKDRD